MDDTYLQPFHRKGSGNLENRFELAIAQPR